MINVWWPQLSFLISFYEEFYFAALALLCVIMTRPLVSPRSIQLNKLSCSGGNKWSDMTRGTPVLIRAGLMRERVVEGRLMILFDLLDDDFERRE